MPDVLRPSIAPASITPSISSSRAGARGHYHRRLPRPIPSFSEGGVGHDYLMHRGIPEASLIAETQGSDTAQSAERVGVIMRANHMRSCFAVSDEYHVFRIKAC